MMYDTKHMIIKVVANQTFFMSIVAEGMNNVENMFVVCQHMHFVHCLEALKIHGYKLLTMHIIDDIISNHNEDLTILTAIFLGNKIGGIKKKI